MRLSEILLPKNLTDRGLTDAKAKKIDFLQNRMNTYVDKIMNANLSSKAKEFLKTALKSDYDDLKVELDSLKQVDTFVEDEDKYEVYDHQTGSRVKGPYSKNSARRVADKLDIQYGAVRYGIRPVKTLKEATHKIPLTTDDFKAVKKVMENPIPAAIAPIYLEEILEDDELYDQIRSLEETEPNRDVRPLIAEWFNRVMPDQMFQFTGDEHLPELARLGKISVIHGYDPKQFKGQNEPITGNAFGSQ